MVGVVAAVGGEVEGHRQALLAGGQVAAVEGVGVRGRGEAGVLPDGPGLVDVHRGVRTPDERRLAGKTVQRVARRRDGVPVGADEQRLDADALRGLPFQLFAGVAVGRSRGRDLLRRIGFGGRDDGTIAVQRDIGETGYRTRGDIISSHVTPPIG